MVVCDSDNVKVNYIGIFKKKAPVLLISPTERVAEPPGSEIRDL
jgi:hypothetical protein